MTARKIVRIDEEKCNGCGLCIPNCAEGALKIINGKAKLVSDKICDGLGACLGHCPQDAIQVEEREAESFDEEATPKNLSHAEKSPHKETLHDEEFRGCPGSIIHDLSSEKTSNRTAEIIEVKSELSHWPIQLTLVPPRASFLQDSNLLIAADCVPFTYGNFHKEFLKGHRLIIGCPKLDDAKFYLEKLTEILRINNIKTITLLNMEIPCCFGFQHITKEAIKNSGKTIPLKQIVITIKGKKQ